MRLYEYVKENYNNEYDEQLVYCIMDYNSGWEFTEEDIIYLDSLGYTVEDFIEEEY